MFKGTGASCNRPRVPDTKARTQTARINAPLSGTVRVTRLVCWVPPPQVSDNCCCCAPFATLMAHRGGACPIGKRRAGGQRHTNRDPCEPHSNKTADSSQPAQTYVGLFLCQFAP